MGGESKRTRATAEDDPSDEEENRHVHDEDSESEVDAKDKVDIEKHEYSSEGSDDDQDGEEDVKDDRAKQTKPGIQEAGRVISIDLWDFMCHRRLEVKFSESITCVSGSNGSGKSAIVNALQIGLGASASSTGRAETLRNFIRDGSTGHAKIQIKLTNKGPRAYLPELLGPTIIVERTIKRDGATESRIMNGTTNKVVFNKKRDLETLCHALSIYVDNPCCVLDQEQAKKFLKGSSKDKYDFFLKATDLQSIRKEFDREHDEIKETKLAFAKQAELEESLKKQYENAEKEWKNLEALSDMDQKLSVVEADYAWALVKEAKLKAEAAEQVFIKKRIELEAANHQVAAAEAEANSQGGNMAQLRQRIDEADRETQEVDKRLQELKQEERQASKPFRNARSLINEKIEMKEALNKKKLELEKKLQKLIDQAASGGEAERLRSTLARTQQELDQIRAQPEESYDGMMDQIIDLGEKIQNAEQQLKAAKGQMEDARRSISSLQQQIEQEEIAMRAPKNAKYEHLGRFHTWLPNLMDAIERNKARFSRLPLFVGEHVKLMDQRYLMPVEQVIQGTLASFIVFTAADEGILKELAGQQRIRPHELVSNRVTFTNQRVDVTTGRPAPHFLTFEKVLEIDEANVYNLLVNSNRIEGIVLVNSVDEGKALFQGSVQNSRLPEKVIAVYEPKGSQFVVRGGSRIFEANSRDAASYRLLRPVAVRADGASQASFRKDDLVRRLQHEQDLVKRLEHEVKVHDRTIQGMRQEKNELSKKEQDFVKNSERRTRRIAEHEREIEDLTLRLQDFNTTKESLAMDNLKSEISTTNQEIDALVGEIQSEQEDIREREKIELDRIKTQIEECKQDLKRKREAFESARSEIENFDENYNAFKEEVIAKKRAAKAIELQVQQAEKDSKAEAEAAKVCEETALQVTNGEKLDPKRSAAELQKEKNSLKLAFEQEEARSKKDGEDFAHRLHRVTANRDRALKNYETVRNDRRVVEQRLKHMKKAQRKRKKVFQAHRAHAEETTKEVFSDLLRQKGHDGDVIFDHETSTIDIKWYRNMMKGTSTQLPMDSDDEEEEDDSKKPDNNEFSDTKALSGGERSTTTLALLLALGRNLSVPFRVMDEFDVFMDAQARKVALQNIMAEAQTQSDGVKRQYILLSPQEFSTVNDGPGTGVYKIRMKPNVADFGVGGSRLTQSNLDGFVGKT